MHNKKLFAAVTFLLAFLLLLTACNDSKTDTPEDIIYSTDGNYWTTDGNYWYPVATAGNYTTDGDYATAGDLDYSIQYVYYATDGNVDPEKLDTVHVSNVDELLAAIGPSKKILLAPGVYDLDEASPALYDNCYFRPVFPMEEEKDGEARELVICGVNECIIASESGNPEDVTILAHPRTAPVLKIENCSNMQLQGLSLGHTEGAICSGEVLSLVESGSIYVDNCDLYGCGTIGLSATNCWAVTLCNSVVHDCSYGGLTLSDSQSIKVSGVTFRNAGKFSLLSFYSAHWVEIEDCIFQENEANQFLECTWSDHVFFDDCTITDNQFTTLFSINSSEPPELWRSEISADQYTNIYDTFIGSGKALVDGAVFNG